MDASNSSGNTVILPEWNEPSDSEIEHILNKYTCLNTSITKSQISLNENKDYSDEPQSKKMRSNIKCIDDNYKSKLANIGDVICNDAVDFESDIKLDGKLKLCESVDIEKQSKRKNYQKERKPAMLRKLQKGDIREITKIITEERKNEVTEKQMLKKNDLRIISKSIKPEEYVKTITVELDDGNEYGAILRDTLQRNGITFKTKSQIMPNLISWRRKTQIQDNLLLNTSEHSENNFLLILNESEYTEHIKRDNLVVHIKQIFSLINCNQLTVAVIGLDLTKCTQDIAVTKTQMSTKSYFRFMNNIEGLADFIVEVTKAVAQIPYKQKKEEKYSVFSEYIKDSNKDTVRIDASGNGLARLWHQMLTMFPLSRLETAEAISDVYPTPLSLFEAYQTCEDQKENLLQNLPIRRARGPGILARRIGSELSRKCSNFFCSTDNKLL